MIKILIADDHPIVRKGLKDLITEEIDPVTVDEAENGREVLDKVWKNDYDVVVLDISMPGTSGLDILKQLKSEKYPAPILILSRHPEEQYAVRVIKAGAAGYLTKESAPEELVEAVKKVARGGRYISSSLADRLAVYIENGSEGKKPHERLSDREFQVMLMIAAGKTVQETAGEMMLSVNTISTYRTRILDKMKLKNNAQIMYYALNEGLLDR